MIFNVKAKKESYLDVSSPRNGCLFSKYCTGSFGRSHLSPGKEEPGQHMCTDINTSLELYISRGSSDGKPGSMPHKELPHQTLPFGISPCYVLWIQQRDQKPSLVYSESSLQIQLFPWFHTWCGLPLKQETRPSGFSSIDQSIIVRRLT